MHSRSVKVSPTLFSIKHVVTAGQGLCSDYATPRSTNVRRFSGVHAAPLQFSLVSCKYWKINEYSTNLRIQKYIKVKGADVIGFY